MKKDIVCIEAIFAVCVAHAMIFYGMVNEGSLGGCIAAVGVVIFLWAVSKLGKWANDDKKEKRWSLHGNWPSGSRK